ncbi:murein L,D-transpeptidase catalytic domain family protein [Sediminibacterium roseum]|uniref:Murein L,D-transpeptidase catalytic domain family protein n=2 Tax=Sediminibacterium roseum TaxID=1978412 RepID=A0ABW9ZQ43_9BACT|nr:murein L,D-transpeptidase catalytic domain family protein [Sediminibacterium roseum]
MKRRKSENKHWSSRLLIIAGLLVCMSLAFTNKKSTSTTAVAANTTTTLKSKVEEKMPLYDSLDLGALGLSRQAFEYALMGFNNLLDAGKIKKDNLLSILDFSLPSGKKRLFVIDLATGELVFNTYAAHGRNSGTSVATRFSNKMNSYQSSLGFYITGDTYNGKHGTSLRLQGEEKGINDNALARGIVMHSASYVDESIIASQGFIGRSQGCPALPGNVYKDVINKIKDGSCLFLYSPDKFYTTHSKFLNEKA